ncbi:MAG: hypothetical protein ACYSR9_14275 [Planctomycetota bacterium]
MTTNFVKQIFAEVGIMNRAPMTLGKRKPSGREKDEASVELLEKLRQRLYSFDASTRRQTAFKLSWMQEDGLDILKEALFGDSPRRTKHAAAYGLRSMGGRMKKLALSLLEQGSKHRNRDIKEVCGGALSLLSQRARQKSRSKQKKKQKKFEIRELPSRTRQMSGIRKRGPGRTTTTR